MKQLPKHVLILTSLLAVNHIQAQDKPAQPNLVFIMADQWRGQAIGCLGVEPVKTPNLDRLASEGVHFTDAVSNYPVSSPARGMLMTGIVELPADARCWSDVLKDQGYELGYIGKWHLDAPYQPYVDCNNNKGKIAWNEWCPKERRHGFSHWIAYGTYDYHLKPMYWKSILDYYACMTGVDEQVGRIIRQLADTGRGTNLRPVGLHPLAGERERSDTTLLLSSTRKYHYRIQGIANEKVYICSTCHKRPD